MSWPRATVGSIIENGGASIQTGPFGTQLRASDYVDVGTPVINVRNIGYGNLRDEKLEYVSDSTVGRLEAHVLEVDDIVFGRKGAVDRHLLVSEGQRGWVQGSDCIRLRLTDSRLVPRFISYALLSETHKKWMLAQSGNKATMASLNHDVVRRIEVSVPPLSVQVRILDVLSAYDDLIENNRRRIALLEQSARLLYREWFVHLRFPGHEHVKVVDGVPERWERKKLSDLVNPQYGFTETAVKENIGPKFLRGTDINKASYITWADVPYCQIDDRQKKKYQLNREDVVVIRMADPGKVAIIEDDVDAVFASYLIRFNLASERLRPYYLFYVLDSSEYQGYVGGSSTGSTRKTANATLLTSFSLQVPPESIQDEFVASVRPMREQISILLQQNEKLRQARDLLLPRLMSGDLVV